MSAIVCGKRSFFEELPSSPPVSKRVRFASSPLRTSPSRSSPSATVLSSSSLDQLRAIFLDMDEKVLERALEQSGDDLDLAIKSLNELRLGCAGNNMENVASHDMQPQPNDHPEVTGDCQQSSVEDPLATGSNWPTDGAEWVELFVREMMSATNLDDARARAARALEALEKSICARTGAEASKNFQQENVMLKEQAQLLLQENAILKRAVSIQHERQKEFDNKAQENQHLKQLVAQYQEQVRTRGVNGVGIPRNSRVLPVMGTGMGILNGYGDGDGKNIDYPLGDGDGDEDRGIRPAPRFEPEPVGEPRWESPTGNPMGIPDG